jgi:hypothetical protein
MSWPASLAEGLPNWQNRRPLPLSRQRGFVKLVDRNFEELGV